LKQRLSRPTRLLTAAVLLLVSGTVSSAQTPAEVNATHVAQLHAMVDWAHELVDRLQGRGKTVPGDLTRELQAVEGQLVRLDRVTRQNEGAKIGRLEVEDLADRLARVWLEVRTLVETSESSGTPVVSGAAASSVPGGTDITVELITALSSKSATIGDRFSALVASPILSGGRVVIPAGALMEGLVTASDPAGRISDAGNMHLFVDRLRGPQGQLADVRGLVVGLASGGDIKGQGASAGKTATGAVIGGVLGGLLDGKKGALIGIAIGAGGALLAERGKDVELPQGTLLQVEIQEAFNVSWVWPSQ
jgi:hypothetical protein